MVVPEKGSGADGEGCKEVRLLRVPIANTAKPTITPRATTALAPIATTTGIFSDLSMKPADGSVLFED